MKHARFLIICVIAFAVILLVKTQFYQDAGADSSAGTNAHGTRIDFESLPVKGMVTLIDLGATECIPCKMMAPIMAKLEADYQDKAVIAFIDVWKHKEQAPKYKIRAIPTQIFYDASGTEVYRHEGFMSEKDIVAQLTKMGVPSPSEKKD
ncbi:MAG: thioredoxin family protein [Desulfobacteraceae bacterium]|nr:thioredoxin family protein [Desulfobacteraceae bacterium]